LGQWKIGHNARLLLIFTAFLSHNARLLLIFTVVFVNGGGADKHGRPQIKCRYGEREVGAGHAVGVGACGGQLEQDWLRILSHLCRLADDKFHRRQVGNGSVLLEILSAAAVTVKG